MGLLGLYKIVRCEAAIKQQKHYFALVNLKRAKIVYNFHYCFLYVTVIMNSILY